MQFIASRILIIKHCKILWSLKMSDFLGGGQGEACQGTWESENKIFGVPCIYAKCIM